MVSGYLIAWSGFVNTIDPSAAIFLRMRLLYIVVPSVFITIAILIAATLPISAAQMLQVRQILDQRHLEANHAVDEQVVV